MSKCRELNRVHRNGFGILNSMAKKDKKSKDAKKARAAEKQKKNQGKAEQKNKKIAKKIGEDEEDEDIDQILEQFAKQQEEFEAVNIQVGKKPTKRLNPAMVANPLSKRELLLFGGEHTENGVSHFYNDLYSYSIDNDTWRKITSRNSPLPRSSHAMCAHPSGVVLLFGGEFSSPKQSTFYHYGDTWILDGETKSWSKVDQKKGPSARSGHRLACWKNYIIMHGGFRDLGASTTYLDDVWLFDVTDYKWIQVEFPPNHTIPDARSGHSLIPCADGAIIYGGYCKTKAKKGLQKGKILTDIWTLKMKSDSKAIRFERRRKQGFNPSPRVGCSMVYHKNRGILFGGVFDYDESEEQLESEFYNNLYSYQIDSNRWYNLNLRPQRKQKKEAIKEKSRDEDLEDLLNSILAKANLNDDDEASEDITEIERLKQQEEEEVDTEDKVEYPLVNQLPHPRFNPAVCVVDDTFYIFGGQFEREDHEFCLDSFYSIDLGKLDGVKVFWEDLTELEQEFAGSDDEDEDDEDDEEDDDDEEDEKEAEDDDEEEAEEEEEEQEDSEEAEEFPDLRPWLPHPKAFETLRAFYIRTGADFLNWAISSNRDARGKYLKKAAFDLCEDRFWERREQVAIAEDELEEMGGVGQVIEKDMSKQTKRR